MMITTNMKVVNVWECTNSDIQALNLADVLISSSVSLAPTPVNSCLQFVNARVLHYQFTRYKHSGIKHEIDQEGWASGIINLPMCQNLPKHQLGAEMPIFRFKAQSTYKYFLLWIEWIQISINILKYTHKDIDFAEMLLTTKCLLSTYPHTKYHYVTLLLINLSQYPHTNRYVLLHFCIPQKGLIHKTHPQTLFFAYTCWPPNTVP